MKDTNLRGNTHMQKKVAMALLLTGSFGIGMISSVVPNMNSNSTDVAQAKTTSARVISSKKLAKHAVHAAKGHIYSSTRLTKTTHYAKNYKHTTFYRTKQAKVVKANGKKSIYQYIKTSNGKVRGWIWHGYLKNGKAPKKSVTSDSAAFNVAKANKNFLSLVNKERVKRHLTPLKTEEKLMTLATYWAKALVESKDPDSDFSAEIDKLGVNSEWGLSSGGLGGGGIVENNNSWAKEQVEELLHPTYTAKKNTTYNNLLDADYSLIGIGWYPKGTDGYCTYVLGGKFDNASDDAVSAKVDPNAPTISETADGRWTLTIKGKLIGTFASEAKATTYLHAHQ